MGFFGSILGDLAGGAIGGLVGGKKGKRWGQGIGTAGGAFLPFKNGGTVGKNTKAFLHGGEYVLPAGVRPTVAQKKAVAARKMAAKKGKKGKK